MSSWEIAGTVLGVVGVWLMIRRSWWAFPVGMAQVAIFGWVCFHARLYSETALQVMFFAALAHGWWHWTHAGATGGELAVTRLSLRARWLWSIGTLVLWLAWGAVMQRVGAAVPLGDAFVFATSVAAQWLQARKHIENWPGWMAANTVAVAVFLTKELYLFAALYAGFWLMAAWGWREWHCAMKGGRA